MNFKTIISQVDNEIARLTAVKHAIEHAMSGKSGSKRARAKPNVQPSFKGTRTKRMISPEGKARIAAAQKARWALVKTKKA